jgi:hypothetical protein
LDVWSLNIFFNKKNYMMKEPCSICLKDDHRVINCPRIDNSLERLGVPGLIVECAKIEAHREREAKELETIKETLNEQKQIVESLTKHNETLIKNRDYFADIANNRFICYYCLKKLNCKEMLACILNDGSGKILLCNMCLKES